MTPAAAIPLFLASTALMLGTSAVFARQLDGIGLRLGMPEALLGLLTALAANAPNISSALVAIFENQRALAVGVIVGSNAFNIAAMLGLSAIVATRVRARHEALEVEAFVGLWLVAVTVVIVGGWIGEATGLGVLGVVALPYLYLLVRGPGHARSRFIRRSFGERHRPERAIDARREIARLVVMLGVAICLIVGSSIGAVRAATDLAHDWSISPAIAGVTVLAILTSLPNAWTGVRFGVQRRGSALMSETLNSNSINLVAGVAAPAAIGSLGVLSGLDVFDVAWLLGMTVVAVVLFGRRAGGGRIAGAALIALYAVFVGVQLALR